MLNLRQSLQGLYMKTWLMMGLLMVNLNGFAKEALETTIINGTLAFTTNIIPAHGAVVVYCTFDLPAIESQEFYAYVTPYVGTFTDIQATQAFYGQVSIGSKVYMPTNSKTLKISIIGVTQSNEAILVDLSHMPNAATVSCQF